MSPPVFAPRPRTLWHRAPVSGWWRTTAQSLVGATFQDGARFGSGFTVPKMRRNGLSGQKTGVAAAHGPDGCRSARGGQGCWAVAAAFCGRETIANVS